MEITVFSFFYQFGQACFKIDVIVWKSIIMEIPSCMSMYALK